MLDLIHPAFLCRGRTVNHIVLKLSILPDRWGHLNSIQLLFTKLVNQMVRQKLLIFGFQFAHRLKMVDFLAVALSCFRFSNLMTNSPFIFKRLQFLRQYYCDVWRLKEVNHDIINGFSFKAFDFAVTTRSFFNVATVFPSLDSSLAVLTMTPSLQSLNHSLQFSSCAVWTKQESYCMSFLALFVTFFNPSFQFPHLKCNLFVPLRRIYDRENSIRFKDTWQSPLFFKISSLFSQKSSTKPRCVKASLHKPAGCMDYGKDLC